MSDLPSKSKEIGGKTYRVFQLPMRKWLDLESLVLRLVGPAFAELISKGKGSSVSDLQLPTEAIGQAIYQACSTARADDHAALLELLASATHVDGSLIGSNGWQAHWPRNMGALLPYMRFALEVQFADFLAGAGINLGSPDGPTKSPIT